MQVTVFPSLFLLIFLWSTELGAKSQEFQLGDCLVPKTILQNLWGAFQDIRNIVQTLDHNTDTQLLQQDFFQNASWAEICHLNYSLLSFYLSNIFNKYDTKAVKLGISKPLSTLRNNFLDLQKKLQHCKEKGMFSLSKSSQRKFQLFRQEFKKLNPDERLTKALGEVDILLTWIEKAFQP
ncbi:interleukin-24 [Dromiciops gliroides]|uniref:interleukin-24 n=1 Tax=Dromiciops gliroides TaxID=33562 RepID=UPI001CC5BF96|nr:interleukin-24 [Dromiciops gliroides]